MVGFPHCKINLGLHVLSKRPDGYHNLDTCFYPVPWTDVLEIIESDQVVFTTSGEPIPGDATNNLCLKAYRLLAEKYKLPPVKIHLHKILPTGAGLGGGSADGAFTLRLLNEKFALGMSRYELQAMASELGSDCAFFVQDVPMMGSGRGEVLNPANVSLAGKYMVLVKPPIHVSTAEAYQGVQPGVPTISLLQTLSKDVSQWRVELNNDFEKSVFKKYPAIQKIKEELYALGAIYASMSGSGASVFGIFDREVSLAFSFPGMTYWGGFLKS